MERTWTNYLRKTKKEGGARATPPFNLRLLLTMRLLPECRLRQFRVILF